MLPRILVISFSLSLLFNCGGGKFSFYPEEGIYSQHYVTPGNWTVTITGPVLLNHHFTNYNSHSISIGINDDDPGEDREVRVAIMDSDYGGWYTVFPEEALFKNGVLTLQAKNKRAKNVKVEITGEGNLDRIFQGLKFVLTR